MRADSVFTVKSFVPTDVVPTPPVATNVPVGVAHIEKSFEGDAVGRSSTLFTAAYDQETGVGTYVAMEAFEGVLNGHGGTFNFAHSATTCGELREAEFFTIVPGSGTGALAGITGGGGLRIDEDGTHHMWFEYELADD